MTGYTVAETDFDVETQNKLLKVRSSILKSLKSHSK